MKTEQIVHGVVALLLGMLLFHMLKGVCGCKLVEGQECQSSQDCAPGDYCYSMGRGGQMYCWSTPHGASSLQRGSG